MVPMTPLQQIQDVIQQFAEAFSAALKVNVEVFDQHQRIAGTGAAKALIGRPLLPEGIVRRRIFGDQLKRFIFNNPGKHSTCRFCSYHTTCHYKKAVHASIEYQGEVIGILGIFAENSEQVQLIEYNNYAMLELVDKLAELVTSKVKEHMNLMQMMTYAELMRTVNNSIDKGLIILDKDFMIIDINHYLITKLRLNREKILNKPIKAVFPAIALYKNGDSVLNFEHQEVTYTVSNKQIYLLCNLKPIIVNEQITGSICLVQDIKDTTQFAYAIANKQNDIRLSDIIGNDKRFVKFKERVKNVAVNDSTVLLTGETGSGKELFARAIHYESRRKNHPFIAINCGGIPETLLESELFGYEKGAFTGASNMGKHGKFFLANKGTIFLDEIETLPLYLQPKLLRALELKEIERIGAARPINVDVRIIVATNVRLDEMVRKGEFREDLFHRLNVVALFIPSLRERGDDILLLADHFIQKFSVKFGKRILGLSEEVKTLFRDYSWPGNVRELQNAIEYAINMEETSYITMDNLPFQFKEIKTCKELDPPVTFERDNIKNALKKFGWKETGILNAAKYLGISRATIYRKIKKYGLREG